MAREPSAGLPIFSHVRLLGFGSFLYQLTPFINSVLSVTYNENKPTGTGNLRNSGAAQSLTYGATLK